MLVDDTELDLEWLLLVGVDGGVYARGSRDLVLISMGKDLFCVDIGERGGVSQCIEGW